jgi:hypothetical protein
MLLANLAKDASSYLATVENEAQNKGGGESAHAAEFDLTPSN